MDPLEFLRVAHGLINSAAQEAGWRTSIGRSYFAVFNHVRIRLEPLKPLPKTDDVHSLVVRYLTSANNRELHSVGRTLMDLRTSRNQADYDMAATVVQDQSRLALAKAESAIAKSKAVSDAMFTAVINAQPTHRKEPGTQ